MSKRWLARSQLGQFVKMHFVWVVWVQHGHSLSRKEGGEGCGQAYCPDYLRPAHPTTAWQYQALAVAPV